MTSNVSGYLSRPHLSAVDLPAPGQPDVECGVNGYSLTIRCDNPNAWTVFDGGHIVVGIMKRDDAYVGYDPTDAHEEPGETRSDWRDLIVRERP